MTGSKQVQKERNRDDSVSLLQVITLIIPGKQSENRHRGGLSYISLAQTPCDPFIGTIDICSAISALSIIGVKGRDVKQQCVCELGGVEDTLGLSLTLDVCLPASMPLFQHPHAEDIPLIQLGFGSPGGLITIRLLGT